MTTNKKPNLSEYSIKFKEFGKPVFKAKGQKDKVKNEIVKFLRDKF